MDLGQQLGRSVGYGRWRRPFDSFSNLFLIKGIV
jgi:hypothetical protein